MDKQQERTQGTEQVLDVYLLWLETLPYNNVSFLGIRAERRNCKHRRLLRQFIPGFWDCKL